MRWNDLRRSGNIEDRGRGIGGGSGMRIGGGLGGIGLIVVVVASLFFGIDPTVLLQGGVSDQQVQSGGGGQTDAGSRDFVAAVLGSTEDTWTALFAARRARYEAPRLVLFKDAVQSACGAAPSAVGPFYCPPDQRIYLDTVFFDELRQRFGAPGDFAQAYVIAHEVGHHVQHLLGLHSQVQRGDNAASVRFELQADCFAGVWAHHADQARKILEQGDIEEALNAASAIGDDRIQRQTQGRVVPDSFTHGSSVQRMRWFKRGLERGSIDACDTFAAAQP